MRLTAVIVLALALAATFLPAAVPEAGPCDRNPEACK